MCITGSITPENKGGGVFPLWKISISKPLFFFDVFPNKDMINPKYVIAGRVNPRRNGGKLHVGRIFGPNMSLKTSLVR